MIETPTFPTADALDPPGEDRGMEEAVVARLGEDFRGSEFPAEFFQESFGAGGED